MYSLEVATPCIVHYLIEYVHVHNLRKKKLFKFSCCIIIICLTTQGREANSSLSAFSWSTKINNNLPTVSRFFCLLLLERYEDAKHCSFLWALYPMSATTQLRGTVCSSMLV